MRELFPNNINIFTITVGLSQHNLPIKISDIGFRFIISSVTENAYGILPNIFVSSENEINPDNIIR